jgi:(R,R)-butanediol dehydrogenase / meso-butanediol dehydrogenase / diacetyl reductase
MKAAVWKGNKELVVEDVEMPVYHGSDILVGVKSVGICGTDLTIYNGYFPKERSKPPLILGHEFCGDVAGVGENVKTVKLGDRVVVDPLIPCGRCYACKMGNIHVCSSLRIIGVDCNGAFAEYVTVSAEKVHLLPDNLGYDEGALIEPLAVAIHAIRKSSLKIGEQVLVIGGGPIGVFIALAAESAGAGKVLIAEIQESRIELLKRNNLHVYNPNTESSSVIIDKHFNCIGPDIVYEVTGTEKGLQSAIDHASIAGKIVEVGVPKKSMNLDLKKVNFAELHYIGCRVYNPGDFSFAVKLLPQVYEKNRQLIQDLTETYSLDECKMVLDELNMSNTNVMKAILRI